VLLITEISNSFRVSVILTRLTYVKVITALITKAKECKHRYDVYTLVL